MFRQSFIGILSDVFSIDENPSTGGTIHTANQIQQSRLPAPAWSHQRDEFSGRDLKLDFMKGLDPAVRFSVVMGDGLKSDFDGHGGKEMVDG